MANEWRKRQSSALFLAAAAMIASPCIGEEVFPTPRQFEAVGEPFAIGPGDAGAAVWVADPCATVGAGVEVLTRRWVSQGAGPLPVREFSASSPRTNALCIYAGTVGESPEFDQLIERFGLDISAERPGIQGYAIQPRCGEGRTEILLAGCDPLGTLYACVTLAHLVERQGDRVFVRPAAVLDWPDYKFRCVASANPPNVFPLRELYDEFDQLIRERRGDEAVVAGQAYEREMKRFVDWMVWHKMNGFSGFLPPLRSVTQVETAERVGQYMEDRGVSNFRSQTPFVGTAEENRRGCVKRGNVEFCWSDDERLEDIAGKTATQLGHLHVKHYMLHMVDHDGPDPEMWSARCGKCRARFGDDRAAADAHVFDIFYRVIRGAIPDCRIELVPVPYKAWPFYDQARLELSIEWQEGNPETEEKRRMSRAAIDYFRRLDKLLPRDAYISLREHGREPALQYRKIFGGRPLTIWYFQFPARGWQTTFHNMGRYAKTWVAGDDRDMLFVTSVDLPLAKEALELFNHEYAWNVNAPGASVLEQAYDFPVGKDLLDPVKVTHAFLDRACRHLYGKEAAPFFAESYKQNLSFMFIARPRVARVINGEAHPVGSEHAQALVDLLPPMKEQAVAAQRVMAAMAALFGEQADWNEHTRKHGAYLYRSSVPARYIAGAWALRGEAERALLTGDFSAARRWAEDGAALMTQREADFGKMNRLLAQSPRLSMVPGSVEDELASFDFTYLEEDFSGIARLAARPAAISSPELTLSTEAFNDDPAPALQGFALPLEPHPRLMTHPTLVWARAAPDGLELRFRARSLGVGPGRSSPLPHDDLLRPAATAQKDYLGVYVTRADSPEVRAFLFDATGNRLDGRCSSDIEEAAKADWDPRWQYLLCRRPHFRDRFDLDWNAAWTVRVESGPPDAVLAVLLPWQALGMPEGDQDALARLQFVFERYWRSSEPFGPAELGRIGRFDGRWVPISIREPGSATDPGTG